MLNVIFPPHTDIAMALYEAAYLIHDGSVFRLTLIGLEAIKQEMGNLAYCFPDVDRFMLGLLRGLGAAIPFTELLATILQARYVKEHTQRQNDSMCISYPPTLIQTPTLTQPPKPASNTPSTVSLS